MRGEKFLTGKERFLALDDIIVSKTDLAGRITYANRTFLTIAGMSEKECVNRPHNLIRHPNMPRCIFRQLWDTIKAGNEIFAYMVNRAMNGDHYWVYAHVTPMRDRTGAISGFHSNRRAPDRAIVENHIVPLYTRLRQAEREPRNAKEGVEAGCRVLASVLREEGRDYDEFIMTLGQGQRRGYRTGRAAAAGQADCQA